MTTRLRWRKWAWPFFALASLVVVVSAAAALRDRAQPRPDRMHGRGECGSCHGDAPRDHRDPAWAVAHGRTEGAAADACGSCHTPATCQRCHEQPPPSHTPAFRAPGGDPGGAEHALLGRLSPEGCFTCHRSFAIDCTGCHALEEIQPWYGPASEGSARWRELLEGSL